MTLTRNLTDALVVRRAERILRRAGRSEARRLDRELSAFTTQAERNDLLATLARYPDELTEHHREVLNRRQNRRAR